LNRLLVMREMQQKESPPPQDREAMRQQTSMRRISMDRSRSTDWFAGATAELGDSPSPTGMEEPLSRKYQPDRQAMAMM
jgi:hypothetical protein